MADTLPIDTDSPRAVDLPRPSAGRYVPSVEEMARQAAAAESLAKWAAKAGMSPEEYAKVGVHATDMHWRLDLDADSACRIGGTPYPYLPGGAS